MEKSNEEVMELFETLSEHFQQFCSRGRRGVKSNLKIKMAAMERKLDKIFKATTT